MNILSEGLADSHCSNAYDHLLIPCNFSFSILLLIYILKRFWTQFFPSWLFRSFLNFNLKCFFLCYHTHTLSHTHTHEHNPNSSAETTYQSNQISNLSNNYSHSLRLCRGNNLESDSFFSSLHSCLIFTFVSRSFYCYLILCASVSSL